MESDQRTVSTFSKLMNVLIFSINHDNNKAADNSSLGNEIVLIRATRDLAQSNSE